MIDYIRTEWYGLSYLLHMKGVLFPRLLPVMILGGVLAGLVASEEVDVMDWCEDDDGNRLFEHPYAFQLFGLVFGYMSVARLNISINRYFEGVTNIKVMHSKWGDAALQIVVFDRLTDDNMSLYDEPFCMHIMHQFKQLSALATIFLHGEAMKRPTPPAEKRQKSKMPIPLGEVGRRPSTLDHAVHVVKAESKALAHGMAEALHTHEDMIELHAQFNAAELEYFDGVHSLVEAQISRILRSITTRHQAGGVKAPPPIVSRVFQELSNGVLAYNNACKMKEVPVPFALVHFGAVLLAFFNFTAPVVIACFTGNLAMSIVSAIIVVSGFSALWLVANELEDPFGYDANDMPMIRYHNEFCEFLDNTTRRPWMAKDRWTVKAGANPAASADDPISSPEPSPMVARRNDAASSSAAFSSAPPPAKV